MLIQWQYPLKYQNVKVSLRKSPDATTETDYKSILIIFTALIIIVK